jgi:anti-sigma-K factor RskA
MVTCTEVSEAIPALVLGALDESERVEITAHIDGCPDCRELYREYTRVFHGLLMSVPQRVPPPGLRKMLLARVEAPRQTWMDKLRAWVAGQQVLPRWSLGAVAAAALLIVSLIGVQASQLVGQQATLSKQLQQQQAALTLLAGSNTESMSMKATQATANTYAVIRYNPENTLAVFHVENMPVSASTQSYQLWLIDADGKRDSGAVFSVPDGSDGNITLVVMAPRNFKTYVRCGVSIEPRGGSPKPTGPAVLTGSYSG